MPRPPRRLGPSAAASPGRREGAAAELPPGPARGLGAGKVSSLQVSISEAVTSASAPDGRAGGEGGREGRPRAGFPPPAGPATLRPPPGCRGAAAASRPCGFLSTPREEDGGVPLPRGVWVCENLPPDPRYLERSCGRGDWKLQTFVKN